MHSAWKPGSDNAVSILTMIEQIPKGHVATYGQIARLAGIPRNWRQVGAVLRTLATDSDIPWHRVVSSQGKIARREPGDNELVQRRRLVSEGVEFDDRNRISLIRFGWKIDEA